MNNSEPHKSTPSIADAIAEATVWKPVTFDDYAWVDGPFFHGTSASLAVGDEIAAGYRSNYQAGRISNHAYFTALLEPAVWGAELAVSLRGRDGRGRIYVVEPTGPFEDDPNVTNKRFPGNVTRSYRTRQPMAIVDEVHDWTPHAPEALQAMLANLNRMRQQGLDAV